MRSRRRNIILLAIPVVLLNFLSGIQASYGTAENTIHINTSGNIVYPSLSPNNTLQFALLAWGSGGIDIDPEEAGSYNLVAGQKNMRERVQLIHDANPDTRVLLYRSTRDVNVNSEEWQLFLDNGWLARDGDSDLLQMFNWRNDYAIQYDNPEVQEWMANWINYHVQEYGFDGCFLDWGADPILNTRFWGLVKDGTNITSRPVKIDGSDFTDQDLLNLHVSFTNLLKQVNPNLTIIGNGILCGKRWNNHRETYNYLWENGEYDGFHCELMWWKSSDWLTVTDWELSVELNTWATNDGIILTNDARQMRGSGTLKVPRNATEDNLMFAYCSTLMSYSEVTYFVPYQVGQQDSGLISQLVKGLMQTDLGNPLGDYSNIDNVYLREFENATVYVNPSGTQVTVNGILMESYTGKIVMK